MLASVIMRGVWWCAVALVACGTGAEPVSPALFLGRTTYSVQTTLLLSELAMEGKHRDVGYRLRASLQLEPAWADTEQQRFLLRFRLQSPELVLRGPHPNAEYTRQGSAWDAQPEREFYALWEAGRVRAAYLDPADPPDVLNYKRALLSLFQFQLVEGEYKETDVSGECDVMYETISSTVFRKIKRRCAFEAEAEVEGMRARRVSRYTLSGARDALSALHAEEVVWFAWGAGSGSEALGVRARSWHELALRSDTQPAPRAPDLEAALAALPAALADTPLPLPLDAEDAPPQSVHSALEEHGAALGGWEAGAGGTREEAQALAPLLSALRAAEPEELRALLERPELSGGSGVWRALGLAGSGAAWRAARPLLAPGARDALEEPALQYLAGFALSDAPQEETVAEVLKLGDEAKLPSIAEQALLAGAAAAARCCSPALQAAARDSLAASLARCPTSPGTCRALRLRALGNLRRADTAALLLAAAERGAAGAQEALSALRALPAHALDPLQLRRAELLATNASRPLTERALALELVLERACGREARGAVPLGAVRLARALARERGAASHELRRALWQRLGALEDAEAVQALRRVMPRDLSTWDARAHAGTTSVLRRGVGWEWGGWRARLDSAQLAARGLLQRGAVALQAAAPDRPDLDLLAVEVWTRGLEAVAGGGEAEGGEEAEAPAAGLQLTVAGAALRPVPLFEGQAELLGHIWAGSGSAPTAVLRALAPAREVRGAAPLQAGAVLAARALPGASLALDAHATVSLWYRTARAGLALRAAGAARVRAAVRTAWSRLSAHVLASAAPRLRIEADLDFYSTVALCVRADLDRHDTLHSARLESVGGARALRVTRTRTVTRTRAGRTLALGRENDAACRVLRAADDADQHD